MICIEGNIQTRDYDDKDGKKVYVTEVVAERVHFVSGKKDTNTDTNTFIEENTNDDFIPIDADDDLPFN